MSGKLLLTAISLVPVAIFNIVIFSSIKLGLHSRTNRDHTPASILSPYPCPIATQEQPPEVNPVISPTNGMTQTINAWFNNAEAMTVLGEIGSFYTQCSSPCSVSILLKPNTINHLTVIGKYKLIIDANGCQYGGYSISTQQDSLGNPLEIEQVGGSLYSRYLPWVNR